MVETRKLIVIPTAHSEAESLLLLAQDPQMRKGVNRLWRNISAFVLHLNLDFSSLNVYQDGLPDFSDEAIAQIVALNPQVAGNFHPDFQQEQIDAFLSNITPDMPNKILLEQLRQKGANIIGTENPLLLAKVHGLMAGVSQMLADQKQSDAEILLKQADLLTPSRDIWIAGVVSKTLTPDKTGLAFVGMSHNFQLYLPSDIRVETPPIYSGE